MTNYVVTVEAHSGNSLNSKDSEFAVHIGEEFHAADSHYWFVIADVIDDVGVYAGSPHSP